MPLYEFKCDLCGVFDLWRTMAESNSPAHCVSCQEPAKRIFSPPMLLSGSLRLKTVNPEPQLVNRSDREPERPRVQSHADGRPWMISH
jgi:putative FmdB family regulatory protein